MTAADREGELLPCPFCGEVPDAFNSDQGTKWGFVVCCCRGPEVRTSYMPLEHWKQGAVDAWNARVKCDPAKASLAEAEDWEKVDDALHCGKGENRRKGQDAFCRLRARYAPEGK